MFFHPVYAQCPVCVITVGGGLIIAKKLGIDDLLVAIWISGLNSAIAFWFASGIKKKIINSPILWALIFYSLTLIYLFYTKQLNHPGNRFLGVDKVFFGMTTGLLVSLISNIMDKGMRKLNKKKVLFPFQKVVVPFVMLVIATLVFKLLL